MMKLSFAILFLFFTLSVARSPLILPENDITHLKLPSENDVILPELPKNLPESDVTLPELPKNLPENDVSQPKFPLENDFISHEFPKTLPESDDSASTVNLPSKSDHEETRSVHPVPLKLVRFRPINRRFRLRSNLPFRLCHHHLKPISRHQIPLGNDMILSSQRNIDLLLNSIGVQRRPSDPFYFHQHNGKKISEFPNDREKFGEMKKDQSPHHHHHHDDEDNDHQQRKISKFLEDHEKFGEMKLKDQSHHHHHHYDDNEDNDHDHEHEQRKISKFLEDSEKFWGMNLKDHDGGFMRGIHGGPHHHHHHHDEKAKEKKKGGFMRGIRKFLHHYFD